MPKIKESVVQINRIENEHDLYPYLRKSFKVNNYPYQNPYDPYK